MNGELNLNFHLTKAIPCVLSALIVFYEVRVLNWISYVEEKGMFNFVDEI